MFQLRHPIWSSLPQSHYKHRNTSAWKVFIRGLSNSGVFLRNTHICLCVSFSTHRESFPMQALIGIFAGIFEKKLKGESLKNGNETLKRRYCKDGQDFDAWGGLRELAPVRNRLQIVRSLKVVCLWVHQLLLSTLPRIYTAGNLQHKECGEDEDSGPCFDDLWCLV